MKDLVDVTKSLFELSRDTARVEAEAFALKQQVAVAQEVKSTLDSWVRHEASLREREQKQLAAYLIEKVQKDLQDPKVQQQILDQAVADIQSKFQSIKVCVDQVYSCLFHSFRDRQVCLSSPSHCSISFYNINHHHLTKLQGVHFSVDCLKFLDNEHCSLSHSFTWFHYSMLFCAMLAIPTTAIDVFQLTPVFLCVDTHSFMHAC